MLTSYIDIVKKTEFDFVWFVSELRLH